MSKLTGARTEAAAVPDENTVSSYGLRKQGLSALETLAQSISSIAPTAAPTLLIPLVFAVAGNGTWLAYLLATAAAFLVALNVSSFASHSSSPGSLYAYAVSVFTGPVGQLAAWGLLLAYVATASAVTGGFTNYANVLLQSALKISVSPLLLTVCVTGFATWVSYRDVKISARLMLWCEVASVALISLVVLITVSKYGFRLDYDQFRLRAVAPGGLRLGVVLALFSFVGFESATTLGEEAKNPLKTIPAAVILSALFAGLFFVFCSYSEVLGFRATGQDLGQATAPLHVLAERAGVSILGPLIDMGAAMSFFACALSCITAGARVLLLMAHKRLVPALFERVHPQHKTPGNAVLFVGCASAIGPAILLHRGTSGFDVNGWMGALATYGFLTSYLLVCVAAPVYLRRHGRLTSAAIIFAAVAVFFVLAAMIGSVYPWPPSPYPWLIGVFSLYVIGGYVWSLTRTTVSQGMPANK